MAELYADSVKAKVGEEVKVIPFRDITKAPAIHQTATGNPITLTDAGEGTPVVDFSMDGKTEQVQTTGTQLFDASNIATKTQGNVTITNNGDGSFTVTGSGTLTQQMYTNADITGYAAKQLFKAGRVKLAQSNINPYCYMSFRNSDGIFGDVDSKSHQYFDLKDDMINSDGFYVRFGFMGKEGENIVSGTMKPMIYIDGDGTWEPYTGGQPSPSPDYSQEIVNGGNWNEESQKWEYEVSVRGSQLWRNLGGETTLSGVKLTPLADGWINLNGTCTSSTNFALEGNHLESGNYTISAEKQGSLPNNANALAQVYSPTGGYIRVSNNGFSSSEQLNEADDYQFRIRIDQGFTYNNVKVRVTLNEGLEALPYEPYHTPQTVPLQSDRPLTKWDRLEKRDGQWGWVFNSNNIVFDGSEDENWMKHSNNRFYIAISDKIGSGLNGEKNYLCNKLTPFNTNIEVINMPNNTIKESGIPGQKNMYLRIDEAGNDVESFKTWLQSNSLLIWYKTAEETFVPLTTPEQSALEALTTYFPTTIITVEAGELAPEIEVEYVADTKTYIDNKFAELAQNLAATQNTLLEV